MAFDVPATAYGEFMGRYSRPLAVEFADLAGIDGDGTPGRVLDVGCGPGALTTELARRVGQQRVSAVDPASAFVAAVREALPAVDVRVGSAEHLPYEDATFDAALAQLVVHFMTDAVAGLSQMRRVTAPGGVVAACVWDYGSQRSPLSPFWLAAHELDPAVDNESGLAGVGRGALPALFAQAGMADALGGELRVEVELADFETYWHAFTLGVGPAGDYLASLDDERRERLRAQCHRRFPTDPITVTGVAWSAVWRAPAESVVIGHDSA